MGIVHAVRKSRCFLACFDCCFHLLLWLMGIVHAVRKSRWNIGNIELESIFCGKLT
ncbi:hypothetical protein BVRB_3g049520 [Beta vulgaris subsp. vulgaris]|nr:hypothetical protein BVRB_3g049520 [Beta vulgaris subsp. vulgaris]